MTTHLDCPRCGHPESVPHALVWRRDRRRSWRLQARCGACSRSRPAPRTIDRGGVPLPDLARQLELFDLDAEPASAA